MKSILITGASSGIGEATAKVFLQSGWRVGLVARRADRLEALAQDHANAVVLPTDVTDAQAMAEAFAQFGDLDVLFNNAGIFGPSAPIDEVALEDWDRVLAVNLGGMFIAARLAFGARRGAAGGSSTTARSPRTPRARIRSATRPPNTRSRG